MQLVQPVLKESRARLVQLALKESKDPRASLVPQVPLAHRDRKGRQALLARPVLQVLKENRDRPVSQARLDQLDLKV